MKRTSLLMSALLALFVVLLAGPAARADATDFEFAKGLMSRGYLDLAEQEFQRIITDKTKSASERKEGELGLCYLKAKAAIDALETRRPGQDAAPVFKLFSVAEQAFDSFFSANRTHPKLAEAKDEYGRVLMNKGGLASKLMEETDDDVKVDEYRSLAEKAFDDSIELYQDVIRKYENDAESYDLRMARYRKGIAMYLKGQIYPEDDMRRRSVLDDAKKHWDAFLWDYENWAIAIKGYLYMGRCHTALAEYDDAMEWLQVAASADIQGDDEGARWVMSLVLEAYYYIGKLGNDVGTHGDIDYADLAVKSLQEMTTNVPAARKMKLGHLALLQLAELLLEQKKYQEALNVVQDISDVSRTLADPWARRTQVAADRLIGEIMSAARGVGGASIIKQNPEVLWRAAQGKRSQRDFVGAARAFQAVIEACGDDEAERERLIDSWLMVCDCYRRADGNRWYEAAAAAKYVFETFPKHEKAGEAAYEYYRALNGQYEFSRDPADKDLRQGARRLLTEQFGEHEKAKDLKFWDARDFYGEADRMLLRAEKLSKEGPEQDLAEAKKLRADAKKLFLRASEAFAALDTRSGNFELAQAWLGQTLFKLGEYDESYDKKVIDLLTDYLKKSKSNDPQWKTTDPHRLAKRGEAQSRAVYFMAKVHERRERWADVLATLTNFLKDHKQQTELHPYVLLMKVQANLELGRPDPAESSCARLWKDYEKAPQTQAALYRLGRHFDLLRRKTSDEAEKRTALEKAADYFTRWLSRIPAEKQPPRFLRSVGEMRRDLNELAVAIDLMERARANMPQPVLVAKNQPFITTLASLYMANNDPGSAKPWLEKLACRNQDDPAAVDELKKMLEQEPRTVRPEELQKLLSANIGYMKALVECYAAIGGHYQAINLCRRLWRGVNQQSHDWFWARYHYIKAWCEVAENKQSKIAIENAKATLKNLVTLKLIPRIKDKDLREKFEQLKIRVDDIWQRLK